MCHVIEFGVLLISGDKEEVYLVLLFKIHFWSVSNVINLEHFLLHLETLDMYDRIYPNDFNRIFVYGGLK